MEIRKIRGKTLQNGRHKSERETVNKVKNEFKLTADEQTDAIKHLNEYCDIDDIEPLWKDKAVCVACNQPFA